MEANLEGFEPDAEAAAATAAPELPPIPADQRRVAQGFLDMPPLGWDGGGDWHWVEHDTGRLSWEWRGQWQDPDGRYPDPLYIEVTESTAHLDWGDLYEGFPLATEPAVIRGRLAVLSATLLALAEGGAA
jgi:hypothetical protein